jgi:hypothetical protein
MILLSKLVVEIYYLFLITCHPAYFQVFPPFKGWSLIYKIYTYIKLSVFCLQVYYMLRKILRVTSDISPSADVTGWSVSRTQCSI